MINIEFIKVIEVSIVPAAQFSKDFKSSSKNLLKKLQTILGLFQTYLKNMIDKKPYKLKLNMDNNPVIKLCQEGSKAEFEGRVTDAARIYLQAWESRTNDYEACIASHYVARIQETPDDILHWNKISLEYADLVNDESIKSFYPSLYINMGDTYEKLNSPEQAKTFFQLAITKGKEISESYGEMIKDSVKHKSCFTNFGEIS